MKVLAMYLPQYHEIKENNEWWGEGYTEWSAVKKARPIYKGHIQPKVPLENNYYDLSDETGEVWSWQAKLARDYGVYGFCIYHYWFKGKQLLEKPMEILLKNRDIDINYCVCWANESWTRTWYGLEKEMLMKQDYGEEPDWDKHFNYLLQFFQDKRYIKINNCPVINIYRSSDIICLEDMIQRWNVLAKENGFNGIYVISGNAVGDIEKRTQLIDAYYNFEPAFSVVHRKGLWLGMRHYVRNRCCCVINKVFRAGILEGKYAIDSIYKINVKEVKDVEKPIYYGTFMMWDNTPRRKYKGIVYMGASPEKFKKNLQKLADKTDKEGFVYINAWNEWGEGAYLEPDEVNGYAYLEAVKSVVLESEKKES